MMRLLAAILFTILAPALALAGFNQQATYGGTSAGTANAQTITIANVGTMSDLLGVTISWKVGSGLTNTGATTLAISNGVDTVATENVDRMNSGALAALSGGEMPAGLLMQATWDGTEFVLITNYATGTPTGQVAYFDQSSCPPGWHKADGTGGTVNAVGQFIRSLNTGSTGFDPNRTLASAQANSVQALTWSGNVTGTVSISQSPAYIGTTNSPAGVDSGPSLAGNITDLNGKISWAGSVSGTVGGTGTETRPQNVALLTCQAN